MMTFINDPYIESMQRKCIKPTEILHTGTQHIYFNLMKVYNLKYPLAHIHRIICTNILKSNKT